MTSTTIIPERNGECRTEQSIQYNKINYNILFFYLLFVAEHDNRVTMKVIIY